MDRAQFAAWQHRRRGLQALEELSGFPREGLTQCGNATEPLLESEQVIAQGEAWSDWRSRRVKLDQPSRAEYGRRRPLRCVARQEWSRGRPAFDLLLEQEVQRRQVRHRLGNGVLIVWTETRSPELLHQTIDIGAVFRVHLADQGTRSFGRSRRDFDDAPFSRMMSKDPNLQVV